MGVGGKQGLRVTGTCQTQSLQVAMMRKVKIDISTDQQSSQVPPITIICPKASTKPQTYLPIRKVQRVIQAPRSKRQAMTLSRGIGTSYMAMTTRYQRRRQLYPRLPATYHAHPCQVATIAKRLVVGPKLKARRCM